MKRVKNVTMFLVMLFAVAAIAYGNPVKVQATPASGTPVYYKGDSSKPIIATYDDKGRMVYKPVSDGYDNFWYLNYLLKLNQEKTIVIPSGSNVAVGGKLLPTSNTTIIATGATLTVREGTNFIVVSPDRAVKNLKIIGGTWKCAQKGGRTGTMFFISFANNVLIDGINIESNYTGHSIELVACSNVTVQNSVIKAVGNCPKDCKEEQLQIDVATKKSAPVLKAYGSKYMKGQTCKNINILNNTISGARGLCANWSSSENGKWKSKFHQNVVIRGNKITGKTSEALALFNVMGKTIVDKNTIITNATRKGSGSNYSYTVGMRIGIFGKTPTTLKKSTYTISNNIIKGKRNGIYLKGYFNNSETKCYQKLYKVTLSKNKVYCKSGKKNAIKQTKKSVSKLKKSGNKIYKW